MSEPLAVRAEVACAVWYWRHNSMRYELCDSEATAVSMAVEITDRGEGSVVGVQFADSRTTRIADWAAYQAAWERRLTEPPSVIPAPARIVLDPFGGHGVVADVDDPAWVGVSRDRTAP